MDLRSARVIGYNPHQDRNGYGHITIDFDVDGFPEPLSWRGGFSDLERRHTEEVILTISSQGDNASLDVIGNPCVVGIVPKVVNGQVVPDIRDVQRYRENFPRYLDYEINQTGIGNPTYYWVSKGLEAYDKGKEKLDLGIEAVPVTYNASIEGYFEGRTRNGKDFFTILFDVVLNELTQEKILIPWRVYTTSKAVVYAGAKLRLLGFKEKEASQASLKDFARQRFLVQPGIQRWKSRTYVTIASAQPDSKESVYDLIYEGVW